MLVAFLHGQGAGIMIKRTIWNPLGMSSAGKSRGCVLVFCVLPVTLCMWVTVYVDHVCVVVSSISKVPAKNSRGRDETDLSSPHLAQVCS